jgi:glycosyltransferase involved in cell wall biosynthesis
MSARGSKPRLLNLCPTDNAVGGVARIAVYTGALLTERGWEVSTVFPAGSDEHILDRWSKEYQTNIETDARLLPESRRYGMRELRGLRALARSRRTDTAIVHLGTQSIPPRLVVGLRASGVPRCIAYCHAAYPWPGWGHRREGAMRNTRLASRLCRAVIACSEAVAAELYDAGVDRSKVVVINTGVRLQTRFSERSDARRWLELPADAFVIASVLRFSPEKAPDVLVRAVASVGGQPLLVMQGDGDLKPQTQELAREMLGDRALFYDKRSDVSALYAACDVFTLASLHEGFPLVLQEAAAHGRPAVATDVGGVRQLVANGVTGLVVPPGDPRPVGEAIEALRIDQAMREQMGSAARLRAEERFSEETTVNRVDALLRSLS